MSLSAGKKVGLVIVLPDPSGAVLVKTARVCWTRGAEHGLHLVGLHPVEVARIQGFIRHDAKKAACAHLSRIDHQPSRMKDCREFSILTSGEEAAFERAEAARPMSFEAVASHTFSPFAT